jgi:oligopeptide/dipeptide ABC transporter ATP-binding protein
MASVLEIRDLHVEYRSREGANHLALAGINFELLPGEILGVLGESGSGKSTLAASLLRLLPGNAVIIQGAVRLAGKDLLRAEPHELQQIRGRDISLIFQEPSLALHPTMRVGEQVRQVLAAHDPKGKSQLKERTRAVFARVFPQDTDHMMRSYPHQLSGGQRQRVLIAQAIACGPSIVIADEPTSSLDPTTQFEILSLFQELRKRLGLAMIFISHNPALLAGFADRILVLYGGRVVELGLAATVTSFPQHPYTKALLASVPAVDDGIAGERGQKLPVITGDSTLLPSQGCCFEPRCADRMEICKRREPALLHLSEIHKVACLKYEN